MTTAKNNTLLSGNLWHNIALFSLPLMLSNILQVLFNLSDIAVVGRFAGAEALGSVGSCALIVTLFTGVLIGIANAVNVYAARFLGEHNDKKVAYVMYNGFWVLLFFGTLIAVSGQFFTKPLLLLLNTKDELLDGAILYLRVYFLGMPALALYNYGNALFASSGDTRRPLIYLSIAGILNVILNLFFVICLHLSVLGVALASIMSQWLSAVLILSALAHSQAPYRFHLQKDLFSVSYIRMIAGLGIPGGLQNAIFYIANLCIQAAVNSFPAVVVEGNSAAANADSLVYDVMAAVYAADAAFLSQNYGAAQTDRMKKTVLITTVYSFGIAMCMGLLLILFGRGFLGLFTTENEVIEAGLIRLKVMGLSYAFSAFMDNFIAASRGLGKTVWPMVFVFMGSCVFRILWIMTVFAHFHTLASLYLLYIFSWLLTAAFEISYFLHVYRQAVAEL